MSHTLKSSVKRSQTKSSSGASTDAYSSRSHKQPSEMLQRWQVESQKDKMAYHEWLLASQNKHKGKKH